MHKLLRFIYLVSACFIFSIYSQADPVALEKPGRLYQIGMSAQLNEDYYKAIETYKLALEDNPFYLEPMVGLAESFFNLGEYEESLSWITKIRKFDANRTDLKNLEGRVLIGMGKYPDAKSLFQEVLLLEPNNLEANFGLAELDVAEGKVKSGTKMFEDSLKMDPSNRQALLTLTVLYDALGNGNKSETFIRQALHYHYDNAMTQYIAAIHYLQAGKYSMAEMNAKTALAIKPDNKQAIHLLGNLYLETGDYQKATGFLEKSLVGNQEDSLVWYSLGIAYEKIGELEKSLNAFSRALHLRPDDEFSRLELEQQLSANLEIETPLREAESLYHLSRGREFEEKNLYSKGLAEYRRALKITPQLKDLRVAYAGIFKKMGFPAKYLSELQVVDSLYPGDTNITDEIEIQSSIQEDSVANDWKINQFSRDTRKNMYSIALYTLRGKDRMEHFNGEHIIRSYFQDLLLKYENITVGISDVALSFSDSFRRSREEGLDYFIIVYPGETERTFTITADLYLSASGTKIETFTVVRTGNDKVEDGMMKLAEYVHQSLPLVGTLIDRRFDEGLLNLGYSDGIKPEDVFIIVKKGLSTLQSEEIGYEYPKESVIGKLTIEKTDEEVSVGKIEKEGFFDMINIGDTLLPMNKENEGQEQDPTKKEPRRVWGRIKNSEEETIYPPIDLYQRIINIR